MLRIPEKSSDHVGGARSASPLSPIVSQCSGTFTFKLRSRNHRAYEIICVHKIADSLKFMLAQNWI